MVLSQSVKLLLCGTLAGALGGILGGFAPLCRSAVLAFLLTLAIPILNRLSRRSANGRGATPLLFVPTLVCGLVSGLLYAAAGIWLDIHVPYSLTAPHIPGWAQHASALLFGILMLLAYRVRLCSPRWHLGMPFLVWAAAAVADGVRFLPLVLRVTSFAGPAFLGAVANVSVFAIGWLLALKLHDPAYVVHTEIASREEQPRARRLALLAARTVALAAALVCGAFLFSRQVGFASLWYTEVVWNHPKLLDRLNGRLYIAEPKPGDKNTLGLRRTNPDEVSPLQLERSARGDAVMNSEVFIVGEHTAVRGWNIRTGVMTIEFPMEWASLALSPDGTQLACVGNNAGDPVDDVRLAILRTEDGTMTHEMTPGFRRDGICWTADGQRLVGVVGADKDTNLALVHIGEEGSFTLDPGTRPHLDPATGDVLFLHNNALWRRDMGREQSTLVVDGLAGVVDYAFTDDPTILLVTRSRLHRLGAVRHYILMLDTAANPRRFHVLSDKHIPSWCLWTP